MIYKGTGRKLTVLGFVIFCQFVFLWIYIEYGTSTSHLTVNKDTRNYFGLKINRPVPKEVMDHLVNRIQTALQRNMSKIIATLNRKYTKLFNDPASIKVLGSKNIDIQRDYYPYVDFKFVYPTILPALNITQKYFMIVLVNSGARGEGFRQRRQAIRQTWGNQHNCEHRKALRDAKLKDLRWLLVFVVGKAGPGTNDDNLNIDEARKYNDMLIGNITDNYINNVIKLYMGQFWASRFDVEYTMKTDDDVYVRIPRVLKYLVNFKFPRPFYGGATYPSIRVNRVIEGRWTVSWKYYSETHFPRFNPGAFFILSSDLLNRLFNYVYIRKPFHTDDAYVGVAMRDFRVNITKIHSFRVIPRMPKFIRTVKDCEMLACDAFGDSVDPASSRELHRRLQSHLCKSSTLKC